MHKCLAAVVGVCLATGAAQAADWPQLQNGPSRHGYSPEPVDTPLKNAWAYGFAPERVFPQVQPIIAEGKVFIGTEMGNFYAFDAKTGKKAWTFKVGAPVLHTAGVDGGKVFFGAMDGCVYALNAEDGRQAWKFDSGLPTGFSTAVLLTDGKVFIANRGGVYFALSAADGKPAWKRDLGVPILMSSSYDDGRLFFAAMDMRAYALDAKTGQIAWKSETLPGAAFKDYWPLAYKGLIFLRPLKDHLGGYVGTGKLPATKGPLPPEELEKQAQAVKNLAARPNDRTLIVLDQKTGQEPFVLPQWNCGTMNGGTPPPCVDGQGMLIFPAVIHDWRSGWGRLDLDKRLIVEPMIETGPDARGNIKGTGNGDENLNLSAAGKLVFVIHTEESNAQFTGTWHIERREWTQLMPYQANAFFRSNTQGGGGCPAAIADGMVYHVSWNTLNARTTSPAH